jgi:hypothetical protein
MMELTRRQKEEIAYALSRVIFATLGWMRDLPAEDIEEICESLKRQLSPSYYR